MRTARDAAAAAASAAPGLGLGRTPRKSEGSGFDEEAPLPEKVLETREERVSDGEADVDLLGDADADGEGEGSGEGLGGGAGARRWNGILLLVLGVGVDSSESESSEEERRRSKSSTARRWSASASEAVEEVGEEGRKASRSSSCLSGGCCDAIAGDDDVGMGSACRRIRCVGSVLLPVPATARRKWAESHSTGPCKPPFSSSVTEWAFLVPSM